MAKTMVKFRAAALNCDRHNKREKQLGHTRPELQPTDKNKWMWEAPGKQSVYMMRKQAEREYHAIPVVAHGKHGDYITHKSLPKNAVPVKEAVVRIKKETSIEQLRHLAAFWEKKYGIRAVGIYIHLDEGHWGTLKDGQTEDMYRRDDGKEWKRMNEFGEWEYWKPNYHAHLDFDWFDHKKGRCISLGKKVMSDMEDDLAQTLGMERGTPKAISGVHALDTWDYKEKMEKERLAEKYARGKEKIQELQYTITNLDGEITTKQQKLNDQDLDYRRTDIKVKGLSKMLENLTVRKNDLFAEIQQLEEDANNGRISIDELQRKAQQLHQQLEETEQKIKDKKEKLDKATEQLDRILDQKAAAQHLASKVPVNWKDKRLAMFCVGGSPNDNPDVDTFLQNALSEEQKEYIKMFYCQGGFNYDKMKVPSRIAMKMFVSALRNKKDATEKEKIMAEKMASSYDISDIKYIKPIVSYLSVDKADRF